MLSEALILTLDWVSPCQQPHSRKRMQLFIWSWWWQQGVLYSIYHCDETLFGTIWTVDNLCHQQYFSHPCLGYFLFSLRLVYTSLWAMYVTLLLSCMVWFNLVIVWREWGLRWSTKFDYFQIHSSYFSEINLMFGIFSFGIICRLEYYHYFFLLGEIMIYTSERFPGKERIYCKKYLEAFWEERKQEDPPLFNNFTTNSKNAQCLETFSVIRTGGVLLSQVVRWKRIYLGGEDPLEAEMATHSSILAWRIPWSEEPDRHSSQDHKSRTRLSD